MAAQSVRDPPIEKSSMGIKENSYEAVVALM